MQANSSTTEDSDQAEDKHTVEIVVEEFLEEKRMEVVEVVEVEEVEEVVVVEEVEVEEVEVEVPEDPVVEESDLAGYTNTFPVVEESDLAGYINTLSLEDTVAEQPDLAGYTNTLSLNRQRMAADRYRPGKPSPLACEYANEDRYLACSLTPDNLEAHDRYTALGPLQEMFEDGGELRRFLGHRSVQGSLEYLGMPDLAGYINTVDDDDDDDLVTSGIEQPDLVGYTNTFVYNAATCEEPDKAGYINTVDNSDQAEYKTTVEWLRKDAGKSWADLDDDDDDDDY